MINHGKRQDKFEITECIRSKINVPVSGYELFLLLDTHRVTKHF